MSPLLRFLLLVFSLVPTVSQEFFIADFEDEYPFGGRNLQLQIGNRPDINASSNTCAFTGGFGGEARFSCFLGTRVEADDGTFSDLDFSVNCAFDSQIAFDYRRSSNCFCSAVVKSSNASEPPKDCACTVCPLGFGDTPVNIDCGNDTVISTCTNLDCGFGCNGTCSFDCTNSGPECRFCSNNPLAPTAAPTGEAIDPLTGEPLNPNGNQQNTNGGSSDAPMILSSLVAFIASLFIIAL